jgi:hypothetical protein
VVFALSLLAPGVAAVDKVRQLGRQSKAQAGAGLAGPAVQARADGESRASDQDRLRRRTPDEEGKYDG